MSPKLVLQGFSLHSPTLKFILLVLDQICLIFQKQVFKYVVRKAYPAHSSEIHYEKTPFLLLNTLSKTGIFKSMIFFANILYRTWICKTDRSRVWPEVWGSTDSRETFLVASFQLPAAVCQPPPERLNSCLTSHSSSWLWNMHKVVHSWWLLTSAALGDDSQSHTMEGGGLGQVKKHSSHQGESCSPGLAGGVPGGRAPECFPEQLLLLAVGFAPPRPWPRSWYTSLPGEVFHFCSAFCLEGEWEWASSVSQRHCWHFAASTAPWYLWRSSWSCLSSWDGKEKRPCEPIPCKRTSGYHMSCQTYHVRSFPLRSWEGHFFHF